MQSGAHLSTFFLQSDAQMRGSGTEMQAVLGIPDSFFEHILAPHFGHINHPSDAQMACLRVMYPVLYDNMDARR